jgi:hypothetical protein
MDNLIKDRQVLGDQSLDDLTDRMASVTIGSPNDQAVRAEFLRRQTLAAIEAAKAAENTAKFTRDSARYMLWSVAVLAISSVATLIVTIWK